MFARYRRARKKHETIASIVKWQETVFPDATLPKQMEKYLDERDEFQAATKNRDRVTELADMFIVSCNISRFSTYAALECFEDIAFLVRTSGISRHKFHKAIDEKMAINKKRKWNKLGGKYQHEGEIEC